MVTCTKRNQISNMKTRELKQVMISGGGTGGHIFPALSIANEIKRRYPRCRILFVGAHGRMEADRVPAAGYEIMLLPVEGMSRGKNPIRHLRTLWKLLKSMRQVRKQIRVMQPQIAIGVGGYASAPTLLAASKQGIPTLVQEQNSYAGKTNKLVGKKAEAICVAYKNMERFFPDAKKIILTGNPVRTDLLETPHKSPQAFDYFGLDPKKRILLILGGSLGARTINKSVIRALDRIVAREEEVQVIWQCGKGYVEEARKQLREKGCEGRNILLTDFIGRMDYAYSVADLVISRAGAGTISELSLLGMPVILVPSPNVAEDHQTKNAEALVHEDAAVMVRDSQAEEILVDEALRLITDGDRLRTLSANVLKLALPNSAQLIVDEVERIIAQSDRP